MDKHDHKNNCVHKQLSIAIIAGLTYIDLNVLNQNSYERVS